MMIKERTNNCNLQVSVISKQPFPFESKATMFAPIPLGYILMAVSLWLQNFESEKQPPFTTVGFVIQVLLQRKTENCASLESVQSSKIEKQQLIWLTYIIIYLPLYYSLKRNILSIVHLSSYHFTIILYTLDYFSLIKTVCCDRLSSIS